MSRDEGKITGHRDGCNFDVGDQCTCDYGELEAVISKLAKYEKVVDEIANEYRKVCGKHAVTEREVAIYKILKDNGLNPEAQG